MPKNTACPGVPRVTDPITDQEMAFAHLILSGTMTDRRVAEALRKLNMGRDQIRDRILDRLWELATLSHEMTRGSIAGQMKALAMIAAIEGLIPDRRLSSAKQPAAPPIEADIYKAEWLRKQQHQAAGEEPRDPVAATDAQSVAPPSRSRLPSRSLLPTPPPYRLITRQHSTSTRTNPTLPIRSSIP